MILHEYNSNQRKPWGMQVTYKYDAGTNTESFIMFDFKNYIIKFMS